MIQTPRRKRSNVVGSKLIPRLLDTLIHYKRDVEAGVAAGSFSTEKLSGSVKFFELNRYSKTKFLSLRRQILSIGFTTEIDVDTFSITMSGGGPLSFEVDEANVTASKKRVKWTEAAIVTDTSPPATISAESLTTVVVSLDTSLSIVIFHEIANLERQLKSSLAAAEKVFDLVQDRMQWSFTSSAIADDSKINLLSAVSIQLAFLQMCL
jgi:hypothetical protein